jgi:hypothetical protein
MSYPFTDEFIESFFRSLLPAADVNLIRQLTTTFTELIDAAAEIRINDANPKTPFNTATLLRNYSRELTLTLFTHLPELKTKLSDPSNSRARKPEMVDFDLLEKVPNAPRSI